MDFGTLPSVSRQLSLPTEASKLACCDFAASTAHLQELPSKRQGRESCPPQPSVTSVKRP